MIKVGVTGGIGSGKTTVCTIFEQIGIPIFNADIQAKHLMTYDKILKQKIKNLIGEEAYYRNGRLNRAKVASIIFSDKKKLVSLNQIVHPAVHKAAKKWYSNQKTKYAIQEAALLVENNSYKKMDFLIVVTAPVELRIKRVVTRDNSNVQSIRQRIENQLLEKEKKKVADFIIDNSREVSLIHQVWKIHRVLMGK